MFRSVNTTADGPPSPKKIEFLEQRRMSDIMAKTNSNFNKSISNYEAIFEDLDEG